MKFNKTFPPINLLLMIVGLTISINGIAENPISKNSIFDLMHYKEVLEVIIRTDVESLKNNRRSEDYRKATLIFKDANKQEQKWQIKARPRGNYRRMLCDMPPLKLKWSKTDLASAGLANFNDLKLVTSCLEDKWEAKELLAKEYLAYQLYNELTPYSFRVQFLKITYQDINTGKKLRQWGFIIEDTAQLAARIDAKKIKAYGLNIDTFSENSVKITALFQYMIGNSDWSLEMHRNIKFFKKQDRIIPVPYDFDFSGFVNAPYAVPSHDYYLRTVQERIYLGFEEHLTEMHSIRAYFRMKRHDFKNVIQKTSLLTTESKEGLMKYLTSYFQNADAIKFQERRSIVAKADSITPLAVKLK